MDPNEILAGLRDLARQENERTGDDLTPSSDLIERFGAMAEDFAALDAWLRSGGFLPDAWIEPWRRP